MTCVRVVDFYENDLAQRELDAERPRNIMSRTRKSKPGIFLLCETRSRERPRGS